MILPVEKLRSVRSTRDRSYLAISKFDFNFRSGNLCLLRTQNGPGTQLPTLPELFRVNWPVCEAENIPLLKSNHFVVWCLYKGSTSSSHYFLQAVI